MSTFREGFRPASKGGVKRDPWGSILQAFRNHMLYEDENDVVHYTELVEEWLSGHPGGEAIPLSPPTVSVPPITRRKEVITHGSSDCSGALRIS